MTHEFFPVEKSSDPLRKLLVVPVSHLTVEAVDTAGLEIWYYGMQGLVLGKTTDKDR